MVGEELTIDATATYHHYDYDSTSKSTRTRRRDDNDGDNGGGHNGGGGSGNYSGGNDGFDGFFPVGHARKQLRDTLFTSRCMG